MRRYWKVVSLAMVIILTPALGMAKGKKAHTTPKPTETVVESSYSYPPEPPKEETPTAGYDGGFFIRSKDGDYQLKLGARIDGMFYWENSKTPDDPSTKTVDEAADTYTFHLRRASISLNPSYKWFSLLIAITHSTSSRSGKPSPHKATWGPAYASFSPNEHFSLSIGYNDPAYDIFNEFSSKRTSMVDWPIVLTQQDGEVPLFPFTEATTITRPSFGLPTQLGIFLQGSLLGGKLNLYGSVGNGSEETSIRNTNKKFTYAGRVTYTIMGESPYNGDMTDLRYSETPSLAVGLGGAFESDPNYNDNGQERYKWRVSGTADLGFRYRGFSLNVAGYASKLRVGPAAIWEAGEKYLDDVGYFASAGMFVIPKRLELQAFGSQIFREGPDNDCYEFGGGINIYLKGHNAKVQLDYSRVLDYDDITDAGIEGHNTTNRIRVKTQVYF